MTKSTSTHSLTTLALRWMRRLRCAGFALGVLSAPGCGARVDSGNPSSSQTHWLQACDSSATCGDLECLCGLCTKACSDTETCGGLGAHSVCASVGDTCGASSRQDVCTKECEGDEGCGDGQTCSEGACRLMIIDAGAVGTPLGGACQADDQCASGICRTETCSEEEKRCVALTDLCPSDVVSYCGCDGSTFTSSSGGYSCVGAPYAFVGECANGSQPNGASCDVDADCASGTCEGIGCGRFDGVCAAEQRTCTADEVAYCGCNGTTFTGSSSCPGHRFLHTGTCPGTTSEGGACNTHDDCESGVCEGEGCGELEGTCAALERDCAPDQPVEFCTCEGTTVGGSPSCPTVRYEHIGACE